MTYPNSRTLIAVLALGALPAHCAQHSDVGNALHRRQVVVPPAAGAVTSSSITPAIAPGAALPTSLSPTVTPGAVVTNTPAKPTASSVKQPPAAATPSHSPTLASSPTTKPPAQHTTPTPAVATPTTTLKTTTVGGGVPALGGGGGSPETGKPKPANVFTATVGSGGVLEYGSCITFESQCNDLCSNGVYSMNCVSGGVCMCYQDDPESAATEPDPSANAAVGNTSHASRLLPNQGISALVLAALAVSAALI
ncbi:hypothetical protein GGI20_002615 [Coemansia sp. BCRC 34301]|nr:hypothetical protein GGI20_002615 [Coemansia sp. BCRC 34301]